MAPRLLQAAALPTEVSAPMGLCPPSAVSTVATLRTFERGRGVISAGQGNRAGCWHMQHGIDQKLAIRQSKEIHRRSVNSRA